MIRLFTGVGGSSKSYHTARVIKSCLLDKVNVISNIAINIDYVRKPVKNFKGEIKGYRHQIGDFYFVNNEKLSPELLIAYSELNHKKDKQGNLIEGQSLVVIDECQLLFDPRIVKADRAKWVRFFCLHRHYGYDIILVTQHNRLIDRQIRDQCTEEVKHRDCSNNGMIGFMLSTFLRLRFYCAVTVWNGSKTNVNFYLLNKKIYKIYDSYTEFEHKDMMISEALYRRNLKLLSERLQS